MPGCIRMTSGLFTCNSAHRATVYAIWIYPHDQKIVWDISMPLYSLGHA